MSRLSPAGLATLWLAATLTSSCAPSAPAAVNSAAQASPAPAQPASASNGSLKTAVASGLDVTPEPGHDVEIELYLDDDEEGVEIHDFEAIGGDDLDEDGDEDTFATADIEIEGFATHVVSYALEDEPVESEEDDHMTITDWSGNQARTFSSDQEGIRFTMSEAAPPDAPAGYRVASGSSLVVQLLPGGTYMINGEPAATPEAAAELALKLPLVQATSPQAIAALRGHLANTAEPATRMSVRPLTRPTEREREEEARKQREEQSARDKAAKLAAEIERRRVEEERKKVEAEVQRKIEAEKERIRREAEAYAAKQRKEREEAAKKKA